MLECCDWIELNWIVNLIPDYMHKVETDPYGTVPSMHCWFLQSTWRLISMRIICLAITKWISLSDRDKPYQPHIVLHCTVLHIDITVYDKYIIYVNLLRNERIRIEMCWFQTQYRDHRCTFYKLKQLHLLLWTLFIFIQYKQVTSCRHFSPETINLYNICVCLCSTNHAVVADMRWHTKFLTAKPLWTFMHLVFLCAVSSRNRRQW